MELHSYSSHKCNYVPICLSSIFPHTDGTLLTVSFDLEVPSRNKKNKRFQRSRKTWKNGTKNEQCLFRLHISKMRLFLKFSHTVSPNTFIHALLNYPLDLIMVIHCLPLSALFPRCRFSYLGVDATIPFLTYLLESVKVSSRTMIFFCVFQRGKDDTVVSKRQQNRRKTKEKLFSSFLSSSAASGLLVIVAAAAVEVKSTVKAALVWMKRRLFLPKQHINYPTTDLLL